MFDKEYKQPELEDNEKKLQELYAQIRELKVENHYFKKIEVMHVIKRVQFVEPKNNDLSIVKQCELLSIQLSRYIINLLKKQ